MPACCLKKRARKLGQSSEADDSFIHAILDDLRSRHTADKREAQTSGDLNDDEWCAFGLGTMVQQERQVYVQQFDRQMIDADTARQLFSHMHDLADSVRQHGETGYMTATERLLRFDWQMHAAMWMQQHINFSGPVTRLLTRRFEELSALVLGLRKVADKTSDSLTDLLSPEVTKRVSENVHTRLLRVERELDALCRAYPEYAEQVERRMFVKAISRIEETAYQELENAAIIGHEIHEELVSEVRQWGETHTHKPTLDLGLDSGKLLARVSFFESLDDKNRARLAALLKPRLAYPGETLIKKGASGDAMYFVSTGAVTVHIGEHEIALGRGDFFGEMALITDQPRNADVIANTYCDLLVLHTRDFHKLMEKNEQLKQTIETVAARRKEENKQ